MGKTFCVETNRNICLVALAFFVYNLVMAERVERENCDDGDKGEFRNGFQHNNCEIMLQINKRKNKNKTIPDLDRISRLNKHLREQPNIL